MPLRYPPPIRFTDLHNPAPVSDVDVALAVELRSTTTGVTSTRQHTAAHPDLAHDAADRFCAAPGVEAIEIHWTCNSDQVVTSLVELLYRAGGAVRVAWAKTMTWRAPPVAPAGATTGLADGLLPWAGGQDTAANPGLAGVAVVRDPALATDFPSGSLTAERSPYAIRVTQSLRNGTRQSAWVYLDVRVQAIALDFFDPADLPQVLPNTDLARNLAACQKLLDGADHDNLDGRFPAAGEVKKVLLKSHTFYRTASELSDHTYFDRYRALWGAGPQIPVLARPQLRRSDGGAVDAPLAVGRLRFLWDFEDCGLHGLALAKPEIQAYLTTSATYLTAATPESPAGSNCHIDRGGKRGAGAPTCFPAQVGHAPSPALPVHDGSDTVFPFLVEPCDVGVTYGARRWAAFSESWASGHLAGRTGVLFQPSRMVGDGYRLHVYLCTDVDATVHQEAAPGAVPPEIHGSGGILQIWRELDVPMHLRLRGASPAGVALDLTAIADKFATYLIRLNLPAAMVNHALGPSLATAIANHTIDDYIGEAIDLTIADYLIPFRDHAAWRANMVALHGDENHLIHWSTTITNNGRLHAWGYLQGFEGDGPIMRPWDVDFPATAPLNIAHTVRVSAAGRPDLNLTFPRGQGTEWFHRITTLTPAMRTALRNWLDGALRAHHQGFGDNNLCGYQVGPNAPAHTPLLVQLASKTGNARRTARIASVQQAVRELIKELTIAAGAGNYTTNVTGFGWTFIAVDAALDVLLAGQTGVVVLQITDLTNVHAPRGKAFYANATGDRALAATLVADPLQVTLEHEFGHALFLNHTFASQPTSDPNFLHQRLDHSTCIMHSAPSEWCNPADTYCGLCIARLWGWSYLTLDVAGNPTGARTLYYDAAFNSPGPPLAPVPDP